ncbi:hypothetical protein [Paraburkholderia elongata]|uniref:Uncharacterized protein n=1 Tax=Paraburkholderia elongata TaxID=2675747 RepID=A0A972NY46_9BURK|nr:hypothetical protein [Paraburkholderia elongata]NPT59705.1 hypothetical protein [Paraburkholderia elongata]
MKTQFRIENPDDVQMTLTCTMPAREWKLLRDQLESTYPSWKLSRAISNMVDSATKTFSAATESDL